MMRYAQSRTPKRTVVKTDPQSARSSTVPTVQVSLVKSVNLLPHQSIIAQVQCDTRNTTCLVEQPESFLRESGVQVEATLIESDSRGFANVILSNTNGYSYYLST